MKGASVPSLGLSNKAVFDKDIGLQNETDERDKHVKVESDQILMQIIPDLVTKSRELPDYFTNSTKSGHFSLQGQSTRFLLHARENRQTAERRFAQTEHALAGDSGT